ncbi:MAG: sigma-70 family RNA polymerase sigma factor, partial [Rhodospirillales bacterium]|nr:sigma-70 family RNA polymerase sigma factor [Rhodospirillales bacterium]
PPLRRAARARWPGIEPATLEDAVQETLLALHAARHLYDPARPFLPFLFGIMRFRGGDAIRRARRDAARHTPIDDVPVTSAALATNNKAEAGLDAETLRQAIARLPEGQRRALELTKLRELPLAEAAAQTGLSVTALKVATHRGIKALRKLLDGSS